MSDRAGDSDIDDECALLVRRNLLDEATFNNDLEADSLVDALRKIISTLYRDSLEKDHQNLILTGLLASEQVKSFDLGNGCYIPHLRLSTPDSALAKVGWFRFERPFVGRSGKPIRFIFFAVVLNELATPLLASAVNIILNPEFQLCLKANRQEYQYFAVVARCLLNKVDWSAKRRADMAETPRASLRIVSRRGLHARLSAAIVMMLDGLDCECTISFGEYKVDARSIVGMMMLGASGGSDLTLAATGGDSELALARVASLLSNRTM